ncbi:hypothetical protein [Haloarcula pelagica]|uniref:hypothetical protein n=1 Tax=Haloarcula pelagica TaxID=3033389 RepID=UPI0024C419CD|nr:hypothetical protein [Halomicroarcula sp. YJ-61-S]
MRGDDTTVPDPEHALAVVGHGGLARLGRGLGRAPGVASLSEPPTADGERAAVTVLLTDFADGAVPPVEWFDRVTVGAGLYLAVVAAPASADALDPTVARAVRRLRGAVDATVVLRPGHHRRGVRATVTTLADLLARPGVVNLDPADVRTVLRAGPTAAVATGTGTENGDAASDAVTAVQTALDAPHADVGPPEAVLVNLVGGPGLSLAAAVDAVDGIQQAVPDDAVLIWGVAVEPSLSTVHAQVVASSASAPLFEVVLSDAREPTPGEACPRCGGHVAAYTLGDSRTAACEGCGYSGTARRL